MKAFILDRYGNADRVRAGDMPDPQLREDDVLVQIHAAGVNQLDSKIRKSQCSRSAPGMAIPVAEVGASSNSK